MSLPGKISRDSAIDRLWRMGQLRWKLDSYQRKLYDIYTNSKTRKIVMVCARQTGKSWFLITLALETALRNPNNQIKYACPTAVMAQKIILPTFRKLIADCPEDLKPKYVRAEKCFYFANGSTIQLEGTDEGNAEKLRGTASNLCIADEAGFMDDLSYVIKDILLPQTLTTRGKILMVSTPPKKSEHDFNKFSAEAKLAGSYIKKTIIDILEDIKNDPPQFKNRLAPEIIEEMKQEYGGEQSDTWRREFCCEDIKDSVRSVVPEFTDKMEDAIVKEWPLPQRYDAYDAMDIGAVDLTGVLFAYLDFRNAKLIIEDEILMNLAAADKNTKVLADAIKEKERTLWIHPEFKTVIPVYSRISDDDLVTINDLDRLHNLKFTPTRKDGLDGAVNELRIRLNAGQIIINPRCKNLIYQLKTATWNKARSTFERSEEAGHYDLVAAIIYLVRNVQWEKNPYPLLYNMPGVFDVYNSGKLVLSQSAETVKQLFSLKKTSK
jgi:hypothetical protein